LHKPADAHFSIIRTSFNTAQSARMIRELYTKESNSTVWAVPLRQKLEGKIFFTLSHYLLTGGDAAHGCEAISNPIPEFG
jgi:hypothetical protein